jgi:Tol biopolymer transport system component
MDELERLLRRLGTDLPPMPPDLRDRLGDDLLGAPAPARSASAPNPARRAPRRRGRRGAAVLVACAAVLVAAVLLATTSPTPRQTSTTGSAAAMGPGWVVWNSGSLGVDIVSLDGKDRRQVVAPQAGEDMNTGDWSPDGTRIAYVVDHEQSHPGEIWVVGVDGSNPHRLVGCAKPCYDVESPAWSPDSKRIAYATFDVVGGRIRNSRIAAVDVETGATEVLFRDRSPNTSVFPRWRPDGTQLAVEVLANHSDRIADDRLDGSSIALITLEGGVVHAITAPALFAAWPSWNEDGTELLFQAGAADPFSGDGPSPEVFLSHLDGTPPVQLTHFGDGAVRVAHPSFIPGSDRILVTVVTAGNSIATMARDGSDIRRIIEGALPRLSITARP